MALIAVNFSYVTGLSKDIFSNAKLVGSWDGSGHWSDQWTTTPMTASRGPDGSQTFTATVMLDDSQIGWTFRWGVVIGGPGGPHQWGIPTEVRDHTSADRARSFTLTGPGQTEPYYLTNCRRLGANKLYREGAEAPGLRFAVWAPNAQAVEVVFGNAASGYIADNGTGAESAPGRFPMTRGDDGIWTADLPNFATHDHRTYMYRITRDDGSVAWRTDLYSRCQIGGGTQNPLGQPYSGRRQDLDGTVSCSVIVDPDLITAQLAPEEWPPREWVTDADFWRDEFDHLRPLPTRLDDLVIYELHVGSLGAGRNDPGTLRDAIILLDHLVDLGINAIELLPLSEFKGNADMGYSTSHFFAIEFSGGGRDDFKHFIRECHRRGIAVLLDVCYNHYHHEAERAEWAYDSVAPEKNIYYWYEGRPEDYPTMPDGMGGYIDNMSTGFAPRYHEELVRQMFISSAAMLLSEFHFDGFRVDQTTSMHAYAVIHADGRRADRANVFGAKFLREWTRTMRMIKPSVFLVAEDHSGWAAVTEPTDAGGLGFDAAWYSNFYHHLVGAGNEGPEYARLLEIAGYGDDRPLGMDKFADSLRGSRHRSVVYHESHDEAGNAEHTARLLVVAANRAPLEGDARRYAEARCRLVAGMALLAPATPMFFMGEEVGATEPFRYNDFLNHRQDLASLRADSGGRLFHFYQDLIRLRLATPALKSTGIDILNAHDGNRVLAFLRRSGADHFVVLASLNNRPFTSGYRIGSPALPDGDWLEMFNSDSFVYGGDNVGNGGGVLRSGGGGLEAVVPANGFVILERV